MPVSDLERLTAQLRATMERSWGLIINDEQRLLEDWTALRRTERLARLRELRTTVGSLMDVADEVALRWAFRDLPDAYQLGARAAAGVAGEAVSFTAANIDALNALVFDSHEALLGATTYVKRSTKALIERLTNDHLTDKLLRGLTSEQAGRNLAAELEGHGITSVVYKDGSRHGLADYTDMLSRTRTAEVYQVGGFEQAAALGITYMEIFDGIGCGLTSHDDPTKANGMILPLEQARAYPLAHPRCGRSTSPRPDIVSKRDAAHAKPSTTEAQRADQAAAEMARAESNAARANRKRIEANVQRRADGILSDAGRQLSPAAARAQARVEVARSAASRRAEAIGRSIGATRQNIAGARRKVEVEAGLQRGLELAYGRRVPVDLGRMGMANARQVADAFVEMAARFPTAQLRQVRMGPIRSGAYAQTASMLGRTSAVTFPPAWWGAAGRARLDQHLERDVALGFHPANTANPRAVVIHEYGHVLDAGTLGQRWREADPASGVTTSLGDDVFAYAASLGVDIHNPAEVLALIGREISHYGASSESEMVAEAFTDVVVNGDAASGLSRLIFDRLTRALEVARKEGVA